jgi:hypothetical protein
MSGFKGFNNNDIKDEDIYGEGINTFNLKTFFKNIRDIIIKTVLSF